MRLTYREKSNTAYQKLKRDEREKNYKGYRFWESVDLSLKKAKVKEVARSTAEKIILEYEWLGDMAVTNKFYGIFFDHYCAGVICIFMKGHAKDGHKLFAINRNELSYFARGACTFWSPIGTASKLLSYALKLERERGAKVCVAFADTDAGEYGTVYQATNWLCIGKTSVTPQWVKNNRIIDNRNMCSLARPKGISSTLFYKTMEKNGWKKQWSNAKYKYAYILNDYDRIYERIKHLIIKYPKRDASVV